MNDCNCNKERPYRPHCGDSAGCNKCNKCPKPILEIDDYDNEGTLKYNVNGVTTRYDYTALVKRLQTDTGLSVDTKARVLKYLAERHIDSITAEQLGSILRLADISDVNVSNVENNSLMVYSKDESCGEGCQSSRSGWQGYNADEHLVDALDTIMGFDSNGAPKTLNKPVHTDQYYLLGWDAQNKLKYTKPVQFSSADGKKQLYVDPATGQIGYVA